MTAPHPNIAPPPIRLKPPPETGAAGSREPTPHPATPTVPPPWIDRHPVATPLAGFVASLLFAFTLLDGVPSAALGGWLAVYWSVVLGGALFATRYRSVTTITRGGRDSNARPLLGGSAEGLLWGGGGACFLLVADEPGRFRVIVALLVVAAVGGYRLVPLGLAAPFFVAATLTPPALFLLGHPGWVEQAQGALIIAYSIVLFLALHHTSVLANALAADAWRIESLLDKVQKIKRMAEIEGTERPPDERRLTHHPNGLKPLFPRRPPVADGDGRSA